MDYRTRFKTWTMQFLKKGGEGEIIASYVRSPLIVDFFLE